MRRSTLKLAAVYASALCVAVSMNAITRADSRAVQQTPTPTVYAQETQQQETPSALIPQQPEQEEETEYQSIIASRDWGDEDSQILLKIAMAEAEGEDVEGKALVMLVVLNRTWSSDYPDSIEEVVFQSGQFSVTNEGGRYWTTEPDDGCYQALSLVMSGWDQSQGAMYFESCDGDSWHSRNLEFLFQHGNHRFYK